MPSNEARLRSKKRLTIKDNHPRKNLIMSHQAIGTLCRELGFGYHFANSAELVFHHVHKHMGLQGRDFDLVVSTCITSSIRSPQQRWALSTQIFERAIDAPLADISPSCTIIIKAEKELRASKGSGSEVYANLRPFL